MALDSPEQAYDAGLTAYRSRLGLKAWRERLEAVFDAETGRLFLWIPVLFAAGILTYFALPREPNGLGAAALLLAAIALRAAPWKTSLGLLLATAFVAYTAGFGSAKLRTELVRAPVLAHKMSYVHVIGWIEKLERRQGKRPRITLRTLSVTGLRRDQTPFRVRISTWASAIKGLKTGEAVDLRATLMPPPQPVSPHGFDYARKAWFMRLGANGFLTSRIYPAPYAGPAPLSLRLWAAIDGLRQTIARRIEANLSGAEAGLAVALTTGNRDRVPEAVQQDMRNSGLAHLLAISGLHMTLMAGTVFWLVRALLAAIPALALRFPIRKWAAAASLAAAAFYLVISGGAVPTIRAFIMMAIMLIAILLDRPALTMRNVALAALLILVAAPESLFDPSFQMSFAAVVALVAAYEAIAQRRSDNASIADISRLWRGLRFAAIALAGTALTTGVAGLATAPYAIYHFHRLAYYGLAANLMAAPFVALLIMPMALLSLVAMPFGLEHWPLIAIAHMVANWPGAISLVPAISGLSLALIACGALWLCLWQSRLRFFGIAMIASGLVFALTTKRPDILIARNGKMIAIRMADGRLALPPGSRATYSATQWLRDDGDGRDPAEVSAKSPFTCDETGCIAQVKDKLIGLLRAAPVRPRSATEPTAGTDCLAVDILIAPFPIRQACRTVPLVIGGPALAATGAEALYIEKDRIRRKTAAAIRGARPWSHQAMPPEAPRPQ